MGGRSTAPREPTCDALQFRPKNTGAVGTALAPEAGPGTPHFLEGPHRRATDPSGRPLSGLADGSLHQRPFLTHLLSQRNCGSPPAQGQPPPTHRVWTSSLARGAPAPPPRQAGCTPGRHAFSFMGPGLAPQVCLRGTLRPTCTLSSSPDWLLRATSSLLGRGDPRPLPTAYRRPPLALLPKGRAPGQQMGPHTHTLDGRDGRRPRRGLPAGTRTRCSSWFFSSSWASICRSLSSMLPCLSSACRPRTASAPLTVTLS